MESLLQKCWRSLSGQRKGCVEISKHFLLSIVSALLVFSAAFAQTFPAATSCTSKDLELVGAALPPPANNPCACGGMRTLQLSINNKTGSTRTSFAFWGTLVIYNSDGTIASQTPISGCNGPIIKNSTTTLPYNNITFACGQSLKITNLFLAWTDASPGSVCPLNSATINPKCGTLPEIQIVAGVDGTFTTTNASCSSGGSITISPFGGVGPYTVAIGNNSHTVNAGSSYQFTNLSAGTYTIVVTDSRGCSANKTPTIGSAPTVTANAGADFTKTCMNNISGQQIGETSQPGFTYSWTPATGLSSASISNPTANPTSTTTYTVTKTNTTTGCQASDGVTVTVDNATVTANAGGDFTITCTSNQNGLQIGESPQPGYTYSWSPIAGLSDATIANPIANPASTITYTVTKTKTSSGCSGTDGVTVTVNNSKPTFTVCLVQPDLCNKYGSVTITATGGSGFHYSIDGVDFSNTTGIFSNLTSGSVTSIQVQNSNGCLSDAVACGNISSTCGNVTKASVTSEVNTESQLTVKAYPNPFTDKVKFIVTSPTSGKGSLEVYNMLGQRVKTVYQGFISSGTQNFELSLPTQQIANLVYVLKVGSNKISGKLLQLNR